MIAWLLILVCSESLATESLEKMFTRSRYLEITEMKALSAFNEDAIWALVQKRCTLTPRSKLTRKTTKTTKISLFVSRAASANSFYRIYSICLVVKKVSAIVYNFYPSPQSIKLILTLLKVKKDMSKATSMLISANKKVFLKN